MYIPKYYKVTDFDEIKEFVQEIESLCQHAFNRYQVFLEEKFLKKQKELLLVKPFVY